MACSAFTGIDYSMVVASCQELSGRLSGHWKWFDLNVVNIGDPTNGLPPAQSLKPKDESHMSYWLVSRGMGRLCSRTGGRTVDTREIIGHHPGELLESLGPLKYESIEVIFRRVLDAAREWGIPHRHLKFQWSRHFTAWRQEDRAAVLAELREIEIEAVNRRMDDSDPCPTAAAVPLGEDEWPVDRSINWNNEDYSLVQRNGKRADLSGPRKAKARALVRVVFQTGWITNIDLLKALKDQDLHESGTLNKTHIFRSHQELEGIVATTETGYGLAWHPCGV